MESFDLDTPLIDLSGNKESYWTFRHAVEGVQIFGGIGSGKTSGSGRTLALKYLSSGFGGLVLTAKPDEKELWEDYCKLTGRTQDLLIVEPEKKNFFNFLDYESSQARGGNSITENIVQVLKTVIRASEEKAHGSSDDPFWETALDMLIFNVIDLCKLAYGKISVQQLFDIVQTIPKVSSDNDSKDEKQSTFHQAFDAARKKVTKQLDEWERTQSVETLQRLNKEDIFDDVASNAIPDYRLLKFLDLFFKDSYKNLSEKTRSIIDFSFSGFLFRLLRDPVYSLFCRHPSTFTPDDCLKGKIILINLPVKLYHKIGRDSQIMFKYIWQRAMEKRPATEHQRPVFLWADEAQNFLHEHDTEYQATARSSRIATVYISQNLPNYYANMGGAKSDSRVKSFLGTLGTKIFHANADVDTNRYASELIGDGLYEETSNTSTVASQFSSSRTKSVKLERIVRPEQFVSLKTGSINNDFVVEGYLHFQGNTLKSGLNHIKASYNQKYIPTLKSKTNEKEPLFP